MDHFRRSLSGREVNKRQALCVLGTQYWGNAAAATEGHRSAAFLTARWAAARLTRPLSGLSQASLDHSRSAVCAANVASRALRSSLSARVYSAAAFPISSAAAVGANQPTPTSDPAQCHLSPRAAARPGASLCGCVCVPARARRRNIYGQGCAAAALAGGAGRHAPLHSALADTHTHGDTHTTTTHTHYLAFNDCTTLLTHTTHSRGAATHRFRRRRTVPPDQRTRGRCRRTPARTESQPVWRRK